jgi:hypothetical protein
VSAARRLSNVFGAQCSGMAWPPCSNTAIVLLCVCCLGTHRSQLQAAFGLLCEHHVFAQFSAHQVG